MSGAVHGAEELDLGLKVCTLSHVIHFAMEQNYKWIWRIEVAVLMLFLIIAPKYLDI